MLDEGDFLKSLDVILEPDPVSVAFARIDSSTAEVRPKTIADHYSDIAALRLPASVPEAIRRHFDTARTVMLYSWYAWTLRPVAELYAYASLEFALRRRSIAEGVIRSGSRRGFTYLLSTAIKRRWLRVEELAEYKTLDANQKAALARWKQVFEETELALNWAPQVDPARYAQMISEVMPLSRNALAHGADDLYSNPLPILARCREMISQLCEPQLQATPGNADA